MFKIKIEPSGRCLECLENQTIAEVFSHSGIEIIATCGKRGTCGHCAVLVTGKNIPPPCETERITLGREKIQSGWRLACQTCIKGDMVLTLSGKDPATAHRLLTDGRSFLKGCKTADPVHDPENRQKKIGLAVDLGTTTIAAYLVDLKTGKTLAKSGMLNPQTTCGEDLMARIHLAASSANKRWQLKELLVQAITELSRQLCNSAGLSTRQIQETVIAGNSAMHHFLIGLPVRTLGCSPYIPVELNAMNISSATLTLDFSRNGNVYFPPNIGGFVGGDHVAMLLGSGMTEKDGVVLGFDIGTNTEITLIVHGRSFSCSAASGPAFEGAHIRFGMRSVSGAIEKIRIRNNMAIYKTIDNQPPKGFCGSGIVDLLAQMLKERIIDTKGAIKTDGPNCRILKNTGPEYVVIPANLNNGMEITLSRRDINEIQLAKAAISAATEILLKRAGIHKDDINAVMVAGAFGSYLDIQSGMDIGMLPRIGVDKYTQVGNAAGAGARKMLLSMENRRKAEQLASQTIHVDLALEKDFNSIFARAVMFC